MEKNGSAFLDYSVLVERGGPSKNVLFLERALRCYFPLLCPDMNYKKYTVTLPTRNVFL